MSQALSTFSRRFLLGGDRARKELDRPVLIWEVPARDDSDQRWHRTQLGGPDPAPSSAEPLVFEVKKVPGKVNAFAQGVTVGRSDSNDVVIIDTSVSRFHAYFQKDRKTERWTVVDAESKFGTEVAGVKLVANEPAFIDDLAKVRFGQVELTFYLPASFLKYMDAKVNS